MPSRTRHCQDRTGFRALWVDLGSRTWHSYDAFVHAAFGVWERGVAVAALFGKGCPRALNPACLVLG